LLSPASAIGRRGLLINPIGSEKDASGVIDGLLDPSARPVPS
jgi:hypothetical protein